VFAEESFAVFTFFVQIRKKSMIVQSQKFFPQNIPKLGNRKSFSRKSYDFFIFCLITLRKYSKSLKGFTHAKKTFLLNIF